MYKTETAKILTCPNCGGDEFAARAAATDIFRIMDGKPEIIRTVADNFAPLKELYCHNCGAEAPQFSPV